MITVNENIENKISLTIAGIVKVLKPVKIFLFGSAVNKTFTENSDLDFLIIAPNGVNKRKTVQEIYKKISDIGFASDIIVITQDEFLIYKDDPSYIIKTAVDEGELVYG